MAEITSVRNINVNKVSIKLEFTYIAHYTRDYKYFSNLDYDTAEGESDDCMKFLKDNLSNFVTSSGYLDITKTAIKFFEINESVDNIKFIDKFGQLKVYRDDFKKSVVLNYN